MRERVSANAAFKAGCFEFPALLKQYMNRANLPSVPALASAAGVRTTTLYGNLRGESQMSFATAIKIARALGVSLDSMAYIEESINRSLKSQEPFTPITENCNLSSTESLKQSY